MCLPFWDSFVSLLSNLQTHDSCTDLYGDYPKGADCYCTPYDGCFHQQFHVIPQIHDDGTNGLQESKHMGVHDSDYFIEVTATNKAMLKTTKIVKVNGKFSGVIFCANVYSTCKKE